MGLAVAYQLALDGHKPIVFEADDRLGGMAASFDFGGIELERFYHFHCTSDDELLKLLNELNLMAKMRWVRTRMGYWYQGRLQPWGNPIALLRFRGLGIVAKVRYGIHVFTSVRRNNWHPLDGMEASEWIKRWVGQKAYQVLWQKLFELKFYEYSTTLSAAWIWSRIRRVGRSRYNLLEEKLGYLEGGSITLLKALRDAIECRGGEIRLNTPVKEVKIQSGNIEGVQTIFGFEKFDKVISTVPLPYIPALIPGLPQDVLAKFRGIRNIAVVCLVARLKKSVSRNFWVNINDPDMDVPGLVEYSNLRPLENHIVYIPFYMPGEHPKFSDSDDIFIEKVSRYLKIINSDLSDEDILDIHVSRYRFAQPICGPGFLNTLPPVSLPVRGLWVADTSYYYPEDRGISESVGFGRVMAKNAVGEFDE